MLLFQMECAKGKHDSPPQKHERVKAILIVQKGSDLAIQYMIIVYVLAGGI